MKRIIRLIICTFLIFMFVEVDMSIQAANNKEFEIDANYGYDNIYKYNEYLPVSIHVKNNVEDFDGDVVLRYHVSNRNDGELTQRVTIEKNNSKDIKFLIPRISEELTTIKIIFKKDNKGIYEEKLIIPYMQGIYNNIMVGVLANDFDELSYISSPNDFVKVELNSKNFPDNVFASKMLDVIIINNYDLSKLSKDQINTFKRWVNDGGHLIIGSGVNYSKTLALLKDFIGIDSINEVKEIDNGLLYDYVSEEADENANSTSLSIIEINSDKLKTTISSGDNGIVYNVNKGKGKIDLFTFDLGLEPMKSFPYNNKFMKLYFSQEFQDKKDKLSNNYYRHNRINNLMNIIPGLKFPSLWSIIIIITIYILLIGPILYLVLKHRKKRHYMWIGIPAISLIFVFIMYISGMNTRIKEPVTQVINIMNYSEKNNSNISYGTILNTNKNKLSVKSNDNLYMIPLKEYDYYSYNQDNKDYKDFPIAFNWKFGLDTSIEYYNSNVFSTNNFELETSENIPRENKIQLELLSTGFDLNGSITNNYDFALENCVIFFKSKIYLIDNLEINETKSIEDIENRNYESFRHYYWDLMNNVDNTSNFKEKSEKYQDNKIIDFNINFYDTINSEEAIFVGWTNNNFTNGFIVNDKKTNNFEKTVINVVDTIRYVKGSNIILEFGSVRPYTDGVNKGDIIYSQDKEFSYYYKVPTDTIDITKIKLRRIKNLKDEYPDTKYYLVGDDKESYQEFDDIIIIEEDDIDKYINNNGQLMIAIILPYDDGETDIPEIYIEGIGK
ncbi:hypothetical protein AN1V17_44760 [Vallitalea sediminicola]